MWFLFFFFWLCSGVWTSLSIRVCVFCHLRVQHCVYISVYQSLCVTIRIYHPRAGGRLYSTTIVTMTGLAGRTGAMWVVTGVVSVGLCGLVVGLVLVERVGRRPLVLGSLLGIVISLLFVAIIFHVMHEHSPSVQLPATDPQCEVDT